MTTSKIVRDPVCLMDVEEGSFVFGYQNMSFSFCSRQCRERFKKNPHLYIGTAGRPSPKQHGDNIIKRRSIRLDEPVSDETAKLISSALNDMMGIKNITIKGNTIYITYDLLEATEEQIEKTILQTGETLGTKLSEMLKRAFIHYLEDTELDNLEEDGSSHGHHHH